MVLALALVAAAPVPADSGQFQSTTAIDVIVAQFTGSQIGETGGARAAVDTRLKLAPCAEPDLAWNSPAREAVVVRCAAPAWRIFVPVNAVPQPKPAPVAPAVRAAPVVQAPPPPKIEPVIRRGDPVTLEVVAAGFSISRDGIAMSDAIPGARVAIKTDEKRPPIQAVAVEIGRARLPGRGE
jgi:flagella basal body P-ring formation protein FlgA